jgi:hypothetical protein
VLAVVLFDQVRATLAAERRPLSHFFAQIDQTGAELLPEIDRVYFQILNFDEHGTSAAPTQITAKARGVRTETKVSQGAIRKDKGQKYWCQERAVGDWPKCALTNKMVGSIRMEWMSPAGC